MSTKSELKQQRARAKQRANMIQKLVIGTILVAIIAFGVLLIYNSQSAPSEKISIYQNQPMIGDPKAPVSLVEFGDFQCPSCKLFTDEVFPLIKRDFIDTGIAKFYFVNYQFLGPDSFNAGIATESVFKQKPAEFWDFYKAIYAAQGAENAGWASPPKLLEIAKQAKIDVDYEQLRKDMENQEYEKTVLADNKLAKEFKITGTPSLLVNGKLTEYTRKQEYENLKKVINDAANAAKAEKDEKK